MKYLNIVVVLNSSRFLSSGIHPLIALLFVILSFEFSSGQAQTPYFNSFKTNTVTGIILGDDAKLTSGIDDPVNDGYLRLTSSQPDKRGFAYIDTPFPSSNGIKVEFEFYAWGGNIADGITFFLFDPVDGFGLGQYGGALGYAQNNNNGAGLGMKNGFLAVGLDEYGNFGAASETKSGGFKNINNQVYSSPILANGLIVVRGGVGPGGEREGPLAYPFLGGKITDDVYGGTTDPLAADQLSEADEFILSTSGRGTQPTDPNYRKVRLDIQRVENMGFIINLEVFAGSKGRWIKVLDDFNYAISNSRIPATLKAGFSASTGAQYNNHEIRNVLITPSAATLLNPVASDDVKATPLNQSKIIQVLANDNSTVNSGIYQPGTLDLNPATVVVESSLAVAGGIFIVDDAGLVTYTPVSGFTGIATASYNFQDTYGMTSNTANITVAVNTGNSAPIVSAISKTEIEDTPVTFTSADFNSKFLDADEDLLTKIKILTLPENGVLTLSGTDITIGQEISSALLSSITFTPNANWSGTTSFNWNGNDGDSFAGTDAVVTITITALNDLPSVLRFDKSGIEGTPVPFTTLEFSSQFIDQENDALRKIKITELPQNGTLKLNGIDVLVNQEIDAAQLSNITFVPNVGWNGATFFKWNGHDGTNYAIDGAAVSIIIEPLNDLPFVSDFTKTGAEDEVLTFTISDFTSKFVDPENAALSKIKILRLPLKGILKLNGADVILGQEIPLVELNNLIFVPGADWNGDTNFKWNGNDGSDYADTDASVNINISPVNDLPLVSAISKAGLEDTPVNFTITDFTLKFSDVENEPLAKINIVSLPLNGTLKLNGSDVSKNQEIPLAELSNLIFVPDANWNGSITFNWNGSDGTNYALMPADIDIVIAGIIDSPTAVNDSQETEMGKSVEILALDNDYTDGITINNTSLVIVSNPSHGTISVSPDGVVTYLPNPKFIGKDNFTYKFKDANGNWSNDATVSVQINGLVMSNVFTPNGDGKNDMFVILGIENYDAADLTVFNRWGNEVYRNSKYDNTWAGTGLNAGTYFFMIKLKKGGAENVRKGWVLLKP